jgi:Putative beta-barrel porin 2
MVVGLIACSLAGSAAVVRAQEYVPVVEDRYDTAVVTPMQGVNGDVEDKRGGWELGAIISAAYDDNIFLSADDPEADTVVRLAPVVAYTHGDDNEWEGEGIFIKGGYRPTGVVYLGNGDENRIDHEALLNAGWRGKATRLSYAGALQKLGDATAEAGRPSDRIVTANEVRAAWIAREKVAVEVAAGHDVNDYLDPGFFDSEKTYGEVAVRYVYSPKTELGLIYQIGRFKVDESGIQHTNQLTGAVKWQPREKIGIRLEAGAEHRKTDNGSRTNPVVEGRFEWAPRKETVVFVNAYSREEASSFFAGQNYSVRGVSAGVSQRLGPNWTASVEGGYERNRYEQVSGTGAAGREDKLWFIQPSLVRRLGDKSDLKLFYRISDNASSDRNFGYDQQIIGVELNHRF